MKTSKPSNTFHHHLRSLTALLLVLLSLAAQQIVQATSVLAPGFSGMVAGAERIFAAKVTSVRSEWTNRSGRRAIVTTVQFKVERMLKGSAAEELQLVFLGGTVGDDTMEVHGVPKFIAGERVILFSRNNGREFCPLVGIYHGKLLIERDARSGADVVLRHNRQAITSATEVGSDPKPPFAAAGGARIEPPIQLETFLDAVTKELNAGARR
jgi:hypothetical protein